MLILDTQTVISQSAYSYHMSEQYFTDAKSFKPERWLGPDSGELEKNLVSFSRGSRGCLGIK
jgi:cytochrome P450